MLEFQFANNIDIPIIQHIAYTTWHETYTGILSEKQIEYMLDMMYNDKALAEQMQLLNHRFALVSKDDIVVGFVSCEYGYKDSEATKIHKLYVLPQYQGLGLGKKLIEQVEQQAIQSNNTSILLNVNRFNPSLDFYRRMGFEVIKEENIDIGNGYWMEDYVLEKQLYNK